MSPILAAWEYECNAIAIERMKEWQPKTLLKTINCSTPKEENMFLSRGHLVSIISIIKYKIDIIGLTLILDFTVLYHLIKITLIIIFILKMFMD